MKERLPQAIAEELTPVLLGFNSKTSHLAKEFFHFRGTVSHVFCESKPKFVLFSLYMRFHPVPRQVLSEALIDFAVSHPRKSTPLLLVACTEEAGKFLSEHEKELEPYFILR